mmetsp:Transcript_9889/g.25013  ORF Transcript_9889/g.25013 Transcript_9889/m.25013 type:complete len:238 (-) Transcript_9889:60-773(-)
MRVASSLPSFLVPKTQSLSPTLATAMHFSVTMVKTTVVPENLALTPSCFCSEYVSMSFCIASNRSSKLVRSSGLLSSKFFNAEATILLSLASKAFSKRSLVTLAHARPLLPWPSRTPRMSASSASRCLLSSAKYALTNMASWFSLRSPFSRDVPTRLNMALAYRDSAGAPRRAPPLTAASRARGAAGDSPATAAGASGKLATSERPVQCPAPFAPLASPLPLVRSAQQYRASRIDET